MSDQTSEQKTVVHGKGRGFLSMSPEKKREVASKGGKAAHALGRAHVFTSEEAQAAGRKGGSISRRNRKHTPEELKALREMIVRGEL